MSSLDGLKEEKKVAALMASGYLPSSTGSAYSRFWAMSISPALTLSSGLAEAGTIGE